MDSSLCLYKGKLLVTLNKKLKEAITLVTCMNHEKKLEAVTLWNQTSDELSYIIYRNNTNYSNEVASHQGLHILANNNNQTLYNSCNQDSTSIETTNSCESASLGTMTPLVNSAIKSNLIQNQFHQEDLIDKQTLYDNTYMNEQTVPVIVDDCKTEISNLLNDRLTGNNDLSTLASSSNYAIAQTEPVGCTTNGTIIQLPLLDSQTRCSSNTQQQNNPTSQYTMIKTSVVDSMITPTHQSITTNKPIIAPDVTSEIFCSEVAPNNQSGTTQPQVIDSYIAYNDADLSPVKVAIAIDNTDYNNVLISDTLVTRSSDTDEIGNGQYDRGPKLFDEVESFQHFEQQQDVDMGMNHHSIHSTRSEQLFTHTDRPLQEIQQFGSNYYDPYMPIPGKNQYKYTFCNTCNKQLDSQDDLIRHKQLHSAEESLMTPPTTAGDESDTSKICSLNNDSILQTAFSNLRTIASTSTPPIIISNTSQHTCEVCGKSGFSTKGNLKRHLRAHSGEKPFKCDFCDSCFTEKKSLKIHVRRHTGEKPYKCQICGKLFSQTGVLQSHMALHLNERKFDCDKCGKAFRQRSQLKLHLMRHEGVKRLECSTCNAKFLTKGDLERHYRIHTGERPYACKICTKTFTRQQSLNEHMNRHTGRKPYDCKYCEKTFSEMSACYKHAKTHKKQDQLLTQQQQQSQVKLS